MRRFPVFTASKRRVALEMLRGALKETREHERVSICGLIRMQEKTMMHQAIRPALTDWISESLGSYAYLENWLHVRACNGLKGFEGARDLQEACDQHYQCKGVMTERGRDLILKLKNTRIAWLEWMIEQVEKS